jgi:hypothetical protein
MKHDFKVPEGDSPEKGSVFDRNQVIWRTLFTLKRPADGSRDVLHSLNRRECNAQSLKLFKFCSLEPDNSDPFVSSPHLVGNLLVFHNIVTVSRAFERLQSDGLKASAQAMAALTPYQTEHINRFGNYTVNFSRSPGPLSPELLQSDGPPMVDGVCRQPGRRAFPMSFRPPDP